MSRTSKPRRKAVKPKRRPYDEPSPLAMRIATRLFTPGNEKTPVESLRLYRGDRYVCGWGLGPAANVIQEEIDRL